MAEAFICAYRRTPIGRFGGVLSAVRPDDLGAVPIRALMAANPGVDWAAVGESVPLLKIPPLLPMRLKLRWSIDDSIDLEFPRSFFTTRRKK